MDAIAKLDIEPKERMQEIAKRWRELKASEQEKYKKRATELGKKYIKDLAKFEAVSEFLTILRAVQHIRKKLDFASYCGAIIFNCKPIVFNFFVRISRRKTKNCTSNLKGQTKRCP